MGYEKREFQPKDKLPASVLNAMQDALLEHEAQMGSMAKMKVGSYIGTGTYGQDNPNVLHLNCDFTPKLVFVMTNVVWENGVYVGTESCWFNFMNNLATVVVSRQDVTVNAPLSVYYSDENKTLTWYVRESHIPEVSFSKIDLQLNSSKATYYYYVWG